MVLGSFTFAEWFVLVQHELLLFAAAFFALGMIDEFALDCTYVWMRLTGRIATPRLKEGDPEAITAWPVLLPYSFRPGAKKPSLALRSCICWTSGRSRK